MVCWSSCRYFYDYVNTKYVWGYSKEDMAEMAKFNANGHSYKPGDLRFVDLDGNYKIDAYDRTFRGQKMPKWTAGMGNTFRYKDFDLYILCMVCLDILFIVIRE